MRRVATCPGDEEPELLEEQTFSKLPADLQVILFPCSVLNYLGDLLVKIQWEPT